MSHFYGQISGYPKKDATISGTKNSGLTANINGWGFGVRVNGFVNNDGEDCFSIFLTHGSDGGGSSFLSLGTFTKEMALAIAEEYGYHLADLFQPRTAQGELNENN